MHLTPNQRMAKILSESHPEWTVSAWEAWIPTLWAEVSAQCPNSPSLLSRTEEIILWEDIIHQSPFAESVIRTAPLAKLGLETWDLCHAWKIPIPNAPIPTEIEFELEKDPAFYLDDWSIFSIWAEEFRRRCQQNHWIDSARLLASLMNTVDQHQVDIRAFMGDDPSLILCGFLEWTPLQQQCLAWFESKGLVLHHTHLLQVSDNGSLAKDHYRVEAQDPEHELVLAATQVQQWLTENPSGNFAIVVPNLESSRTSVLRIFSKQFGTRNVDISAPISLDQYPIIHAALTLLSFSKHNIPLSAIGEYFNSPYLGVEEEWCERSALDVLLRERGEAEYTLKRLVIFLQDLNLKLPMPGARLSLSILETMLELSGSHQTKRTTFGWRKVWEQMLSSAQWSGARELSGLNSEEYQAVERWKVLLDQYGQLDRILGEHTKEHSLRILGQLARETLFLPKSHGAKIQVLGMLEAVGIPFDGIWITQIQRESWPMPPNPNPFIPIALQRMRQSPRSSADRELQNAKRIMDAFHKASNNVIFSYSKMLEDLESAPSALIASLSLKTVHQENKSIFTNHEALEENLTVTQANMDETKSTQIGILMPLALPKNTLTPGGTLALKLQAACPFRAFAELRLGAKPLPKTRLRLNEAERGELIHQILQLFWKEIPSQKDLLNLSQTTIEERLNTAIYSVLESYQTKFPRRMTVQYSKIEAVRIHDLLLPLIELEKSRPPFSIQGQEIQGEVDVGPLRLKIRIDRLDLNADDDPIVVDYKTGKISLSDWFGDRPNDPQLPLYCITQPKRPQALLIESIRPEKIQFLGLTSHEESIPGLKTPAQTQRFGSDPEFESQCQQWEKTLTRLAEDFYEGIATVDPKHGEATCRECSLKPLCRYKTN